MKLRTLTTAAALIAAGAAYAQSSGNKQEQAACRSDVRRLCSHIGKGENQQYRDCLQAHFQELSQKCRQVLMEHQNGQ